MQNAFIAQLLRKAEEPEPAPQVVAEAAADENPEMHDSALLRDQTADTVTCPVCGAACQEQRGKQFTHVWCPTLGHFDSWRATPGHKLGDGPLFDEWRGKEKSNDRKRI